MLSNSVDRTGLPHSCTADDGPTQSTDWWTARLPKRRAVLSLPFFSHSLVTTCSGTGFSSCFRSGLWLFLRNGNCQAVRSASTQHSHSSSSIAPMARTPTTSTLGKAKGTFTADERKDDSVGCRNSDRDTKSVDGFLGDESSLQRKKGFGCCRDMGFHRGFIIFGRCNLKLLQFTTCYSQASHHFGKLSAQGRRTIYFLSRLSVTITDTNMEFSLTIMHLIEGGGGHFTSTPRWGQERTWACPASHGTP